MRDYEQFDKYIARLSQDVYAQPPDPGHLAWASQSIATMCSIPQGISNVLDIGCGQGFARKQFEEKLGLEWTGITIGEDYMVCMEDGLNVLNRDMTFTGLDDNSFDLLFARHVLEHSPFPVVTLMEWRRLCRGWLCLVTPAPGYWGLRGRNHYSVLAKDHLKWLLKRAGWNVMHEFDFTTRDPLFLQHLLPYRRALAKEEGKVIPEPPDGSQGLPIKPLGEVLRDYPDQPVEFRMLCERIEPEVE